MFVIMTAGKQIQFISPNLTFVSNPSRMISARFHRFGRKVKNDRFVLVWVKQENDCFRLQSICESQIKRSKN